MKTMAEVLGEHDDDSVDSGYWYCRCGYEYGVFGGFGEAKAGHQEAMLTAAGFGPVKAAAAEAWDEGRESLALDFTKKMDSDGLRHSTTNPYRAATIEV